MLQRLKALAQSGLDESVIRRASTLLAFTVPAALFNLLFTYVAARQLLPAEFGIFYAAITAVNILFAPAVIFNLLFSRYVATVYTRDGLEQAQASYSLVIMITLRWLSRITLVGLAAILVFGVIGGKFSSMLAVIVLAIVATSYFAECGRIFLQGEQRFLTLGVYTLVWMGGRLAFGCIGLWTFGTVWGGLAGVILSAPVVFLLFFGFKPFASQPSQLVEQSPPGIGDLVPFAIGYAIFAAAAHADIIVAYLTLAPYQLGVYSASSVLPKGILMLTLPIIQLAFPLMVGKHVDAAPGFQVILKGFLLTGAVAMSGVMVTLLFRAPICASQFGIATCDVPTMIYGALAMVPFALVRFLVSVDYSAHRDWVPSLLIIPLAIFVGVNSELSNDPRSLAMLFALFSLIALLLYPALRFAQPLLARFAPQSP